MSFDEIFDLTAGVYLNLYNILLCHIKRAQRHNSAAHRPAAVQPPSSNSLQLYARVAADEVGDNFDRRLRCSIRLYASTSRCCCCFRCFCQVVCWRKV